MKRFDSHKKGYITVKTCPGLGSNQQPSDQKSSTLPLDTAPPSINTQTKQTIGRVLFHANFQDFRNFSN